MEFLEVAPMAVMLFVVLAFGFTAVSQMQTAKMWRKRCGELEQKFDEYRDMLRNR